MLNLDRNNIVILKQKKCLILITSQKRKEM